MMRPLTIALLLLIPCLPAWSQSDAYYDKIHGSMESFGAVFREITTEYVDRTDPEEIVKAGIRGMLRELDPYTVYLENPDEAESVERLSSGHYIGFGFSISNRNGLLTISDIKKGFPAERAGVRIGDRMVSVDFNRTDSLTVDSVRHFLRGDAGSNALFRFVRDGRGDTLTMNLVREQIPVVNVMFSQMMKGKIAYVKLDRFSRDAGRELRWTLDELITQQPVSAVILDLRGNPGGLLEAAVRVCELFLPRNSLIVSTRDRMGRLREYRSEREPLLADLPLVVLIDKFSASASEIVAGAIQDHDRGVIIGRRSFGKGLVQTVVPLPHEASLKMTTARYYTPSGRCIQKLYRPDPTQDSSGTFVTRNGRLMRPSSGIYPDIELTQAPYPGCVDELVTSWTIGEFATRVTSAISALSPDFRVDRSLMKQFYAFVDSLPAQRRSRQELRLQSVLDELQADGAPKDVVRSVRTALAALKADRMRELQGQSTVIGQLIDAEIRARFGTEADRERQLLSIDDAVSTALEVVNSGRYSTVLEATALSD